MRTVEFTVAPVAGGWIVEGPSDFAPLLFLSGGRAEAKAEALARAIAATGGEAKLVVLDRKGQPIGTKLYRAHASA